MLHHNFAFKSLEYSQRCFAKVLSKSRRFSTSSYQQTFWNWTTQVRPSWRHNFKEAAIIFTVFGVTGSSSVYFVRPALKYSIGLEVRDRFSGQQYFYIYLVKPVTLWLPLDVIRTNTILGIYAYILIHIHIVNIGESDRRTQLLSYRKCPVGFAYICCYSPQPRKFPVM